MRNAWRWWATGLCLTLAACDSNNSAPGAGDPAPDRNSPAAIADKIGIEGAFTQSGELPPSSPLDSAPTLSATQRNLIAAPNTTQTVSVAVDVAPGSALAVILAKITGSDSFFVVEQRPTTRKRISSSGKALVATVLRVNLQADLLADAFCLDLLAQDDALRTSNALRVCFALPGNNPAGEQPLANAGPDQVARAGETVRLVGSGTSPGAAISDFSWTQLAGPAVNLSGSNSSILSFVAPAVSANTTSRFRLRVSDERGLVADDTVDVLVAAPGGENQPPVAEAGPPLRVAAEREAVLRGDDFDADGSIATRQWTQIDGPDVSLDGATTATARFITPRFDEDTLLSFRYTVTDDGGAEAADGTTVSVAAEGTVVNMPPVANAGQDQVTTSGTTVTLNGGGSSDADGQIVRFGWSQLAGDPVTLAGADTARPSFTAPAQLGELEFLLTVTDDDGATTGDNVFVTITDTPPVDAPVANAGPDQTVPAGSQVTLDGSFSSDPGGGSLQFQWSQIGGPDVTLVNAMTAIASFTAPDGPDGEVLSFQLSVTDEDQLSDSDQVNITLGAPPVEESEIAFVSGNVQVAESVGLTAVGITITPASDTTFTLPFNVSGTASPGADFELVTPSPLTIDAGAGSAAIELNITDDGVAEGDETIVLTLGQPSAGQLGTNTEIVVTIVDGGSGSTRAVLFGVNEDDELVEFFADTPGTFESRVQIDQNIISGFAIAMDIRPATGQIYLLYTDRGLYTVDEVTGEATLVGLIPQNVFDADIRAMGFDPLTDEIRMVGAGNGENFRISPADASLIATDTMLIYAPGDPNAGNGIFPTGFDYSGSTGGARTAYFLEDFGDNLGQVGTSDDTGSSANGGQAFTIANLAFGSPQGLTVQTTSPIGYTLRPGARSGHSDLGRVDLETGALTIVGEIGNEPERFAVLVIAVVPGTGEGR